MCGIFATTRADLWVHRLDTVLALLRHRGPDDEGSYLDGDAGVLLAHTRLAIVGLGDVGRQPHRSGPSVLAYNGELYNYRAVARSMGVDPPACDTPLVHEVLRRRGPVGLDDFDGMFALAQWDSATGRLVLARDPWGVKPLYVLSHPDGGITASSELAPLLLETKTVDPLGLAQYMVFGHTTSTSTVYDRITKLPAGTFTALTRAGVGWVHRSGTYRRYERRSAPSVAVATEQATKDQLMADVPVGVFLSGGVDSTLLAASARQHCRELKSFTISFPESPAIDESAGAEHNASLIGLDHQTVPVTVAEMIAAAGPVLARAGEPVGDAAALAMYCLSAEATGKVKVVLTGEGADELFGGYVRHRVIRRLDRARLHLIAPALAPAARSWSDRRGDRPWQRAVAAGLAGGGPLGYAAMSQAELGLFPSRPDIEDSLEAVLRMDWAAAVETAGHEWAATRFDLSRWLPNTYLEKIDRTTMAHSLEGRVPYLSLGMEAAALAVVSPGKQALRDAVVAKVPGVRLPSRKKGLAIDVGAVVAGLHKELDEVLRSPESILVRMFGAAVAARIQVRTRRSPTIAFRVAMIGLWQHQGNIGA